ncbi:hypothetical protein AB0B15_14075 [Streptomyces sp. NPDC045456]|uniref:hypothetical protein n=1 Tax=Streptomyces sp. NPDC045456 TaxID=3155254 RepID=UPI00340B6E3C
MTTEKMLTVAEGAALIGAPTELRAAPVAETHAESDVAERFARDTAQHEMTVLHDDGLYRHLRFMAPRSSEYWFDLITWPGRLAMCGDVGDDYVFSRTADMFEFFRSDRDWGINPHYWAEKLGGGRESVKEYSEELFKRTVKEHVADAIRYGDAPRGIGRAVRAEILGRFDLYDEEAAREALEEFEYEGFRFDDVWEWDFREYAWSFLWACHAIVSGIGRYDTAKAVAA